MSRNKMFTFSIPTYFFAVFNPDGISRIEYLFFKENKILWKCL